MNEIIQVSDHDELKAAMASHHLTWPTGKRAKTPQGVSVPLRRLVSRAKAEGASVYLSHFTDQRGRERWSLMAANEAQWWVVQTWVRKEKRR